MKPVRSLLFLLLVTIAGLGCRDYLHGDGFADPPDEGFYSFSWQGERINDTLIEAGRFGYDYSIRVFPEVIANLPKARFIFSGPGTVYVVEYSKTIPTTATLIPIDELEAYYGNGVYGLYRPPANDEVPAEGITVTFACEVLNPDDEWERSPDYKMRVVRREKPMDFYLDHDKLDVAYDIQPTSVTTTSGNTYTCVLCTLPHPAEDMQLQYGLKGADGYLGNLGELTVETQELFATVYWGCNYTAPEDITSPVDITAWFSIYDPWIKQKRELELTFHVAPKE